MADWGWHMVMPVRTTVPRACPMSYSSAPSSENQDGTTVPRACSTVMPPLQRIKTGPQSPGHVLQLCPLFRESRQDHSTQGMSYSYAPSSENQDRTTVPRACSTVMPPLQRIKTGPQSPGHVLQLCPLFRESRQDHSPQGMFYNYAPSSENQDRTTVPRACPTVMPPLQRIKTGPQSPGHVLQLCPLFRESRQDHSPQGMSYSSASLLRESRRQQRPHETTPQEQL